MGNPLLDNGLKVLEFARHNTLRFLEDVPEDKLCHQPIAKANHALWIMGHLAQTDNYMLSGVAGKPSNIPEGWEGLFGMGSEPIPDAAAYPSLAQIKDVLCQHREDLVGWLTSLSDSELIEPLDGDWQQFAPNKIGLAFALAWHEGLHCGQLTLVRKSLGIAPKFG